MSTSPLRDTVHQQFIEEDRVSTPAHAQSFYERIQALRYEAQHRGLRKTARRLEAVEQAALEEMKTIGADELAPNGIAYRAPGRIR
jgi:hypothetical protein